MVLLGILLPVAGYVGWFNYQRMKGGEADGGLSIPFLQHQQQQTFAAPPNTMWPHFPAEECWLVDETARDIAELLAFARNPAGKLEFTAEPIGYHPRNYQLSATLDGTEVKQPFAVKESIWSPEDYSAWAQQLLTEWKLQPAAKPGPTAADFLASLTDAAPQTLIKESKRVSEALNQNPLDASLHEQAALLIAAFALREAAGEFNDTRRELCRVAAHLAIARALQPTSAGPIRPIAEAALQSLAGRETAAMEILKTPVEAPGAISWARALRLRSTGNWQLEADATVPLEMVEAFRARARSVNAHFAILWAKQQKPSPLHDLRRLVLEDVDLGVEDGHGFANDSLGQEAVSLGADWKDYFGGELQKSDFIKALSEPAGRAVSQKPGQPARIQVLGWDFWSAQHQRHFCASLQATNYFLRDLWGVPEFQSFQQFANLNFPSLALYPLLEREMTEDPRNIDGISQRVSALIKNHPELVSPALWENCFKPSGSKMHTLNVLAPIWFNPLVPPGTTYGFWQRCYGYPLPPSEDPSWDRLLEISPSEYLPRYGKVWKSYGDHPPAGLAEKVYAPILGYNLHALKHLAKTQAEQSAQYGETMQRVCKLDPDQYWILGNWYLTHKDEANAAEAYRKGVDLGEDRIRAANSCGWLVNYLDDHGQPEKALAIATEAADVYSFRGLETMAKLKEKHQQFKEAEDIYQKIAERYDEGGASLAEFYLRNADKDPSFKKLATGMVKQLFPEGMTKVTLADFKATPDEGEQLTSTSPSSAAAGLQSGDVIVALDGYLVRNDEQYLYVRSLTADPKMQLIVWNPQGYREIAASAPERRFNVDLKTYKLRKFRGGK